jgi:hypothetical protein
MQELGDRAFEVLATTGPLRTMKTLAFLFLTLALAGCQTDSNSYKFSGGDGSTRQRAVVIKAPDLGVGMAAEMVWMKERYDDWTETTDRYERVDHRLYHEVEITRGGQTNRVYFDFTDFAPDGGPR